MQIGEDIDIRLGPSEITYLGKGKFQINDQEYQFDKVSRREPVKQVVRILIFLSRRRS